MHWRLDSTLFIVIGKVTYLFMQRHVWQLRRSRQFTLFRQNTETMSVYLLFTVVSWLIQSKDEYFYSYTIFGIIIILIRYLTLIICHLDFKTICIVDVENRRQFSRRVIDICIRMRSSSACIFSQLDFIIFGVRSGKLEQILLHLGPWTPYSRLTVFFSKVVNVLLLTRDRRARLLLFE